MYSKWMGQYPKKSKSFSVGVLVLRNHIAESANNGQTKNAEMETAEKSQVLGA